MEILTNKIKVLMEMMELMEEREKVQVTLFWKQILLKILNS